MIHNQEMDTDLKFRLASEYCLQELQDYLVKDIKTMEDADKVFKISIKHMSKDFCMKVLQNVYH